MWWRRLQIDTPFDPQGAHAAEFIQQARRVIDKVNAEQRGVMSFHLALGLTEMFDMTNQVLDLFPVVIAASMGIIFLLVAIGLRSVVNALVLVFTVALTLSWSYGAAVIVFQSSLFNFAGTYMDKVS